METPILKGKKKWSRPNSLLDDFIRFPKKIHFKDQLTKVVLLFALMHHACYVVLVLCFLLSIYLP